MSCKLITSSDFVKSSHAFEAWKWNGTEHKPYQIMRSQSILMYLLSQATSDIRSEFRRGQVLTSVQLELDYNCRGLQFFPGLMP